MKFNPDVLRIKPADETQKVADFVVEEVKKVYRRRGVVVGLSGGVDSAVMAAPTLPATTKEVRTGPSSLAMLTATIAATYIVAPNLAS